MTQNSNTNDWLAKLEELRRVVLDIAEHYNDTDYQARKYQTMHARSNVNGAFGEFEEAIQAKFTEQSKQHQTARLRELNLAADHWFNCDGDSCPFNHGGSGCLYFETRCDVLTKAVQAQLNSTTEDI